MIGWDFDTRDEFEKIRGKLGIHFGDKYDGFNKPEITIVDPILKSTMQTLYVMLEEKTNSIYGDSAWVLTKNLFGLIPQETLSGGYLVNALFWYQGDVRNRILPNNLKRDLRTIIQGNMYVIELKVDGSKKYYSGNDPDELLKLYPKLFFKLREQSSYLFS